MSQQLNTSSPPLSPTELRSSQLDVPRHAPETIHGLGQDAPLRRFVTHRLKRGDRGQLLDRVLPSMPLHDDGMSMTPAEMPVSKRARVFLRHQELKPFEGIFPPDGRRPFTDTTFPWRCVCQVVSGTRNGSGVLIGRRHVLTASHVMDWNALSVSVSFVRGAATLATAVATHVIAYEKINDVEYDNADSDYVVAVLDTPVGDSLGFLGAKTYDSSWDDAVTSWMNIAYAPDISGGTFPSFQTDFTLDEDDYDLGGGRALFTKSGDFVNGMSGSPVFGNWPEGPFVVGVVSSGGDGVFGRINVVAAGSDLTNLVTVARRDFP